MTARLPLPAAGDHDAAVAWVETHLADVVGDTGGAEAEPSQWPGGQSAADAALAAFDVTGYATDRTVVFPERARGASRLSPYIRHGLLPLRRVHKAVADGPAADVAKFRDELLWQEYGRHVYARLGATLRRPLRAMQPSGTVAGAPAWDDTCACVAACRDELESTGWIPNHARLWLAAQWGVVSGADWRDGEDRFFAALLDGSRASNRMGWQWTVGTGTGRPYVLARAHVELRAPGLCDGCARRDACPFEGATEPVVVPVDPDPLLRADPAPAATAGPRAPERVARPDVVWLTAESLGDADPALVAQPELPVHFVFDAPLLTRVRLASRRLVFLVECLADLALRRDVVVAVGDPADEFAGRAVATTFTPVPGGRRLRRRVEVAELHPWPWLVAPHDGRVTSFTAWRKAAGV